MEPTRTIGQGTLKDRGWAWMIVLGCSVNYFLFLGVTKTIGLIQLHLSLYFGSSTIYASLPVVVAFVVYSVFSPVAIVLAEAFGIRRIVILGSLVGSVGLALSSLLVNLPWFIVFFGFAHGICAACTYGNCLVILGHYFDKRLALANGVALAGASCGQFVYPVIFEYLIETYGFQGAILILSGIYSHTILFGALLRPAKPCKSNEIVEDIGCNEAFHLISTSHTEPVCFDEDKSRNGLESKEVELNAFNPDRDDYSQLSEVYEKNKNKNLILEQKNNDNQRLYERNSNHSGTKLAPSCTEQVFSATNQYVLSDASYTEIRRKKSPLNRENENVKESKTFCCKDFSLLRNYLSLTFIAYFFFLSLGLANFTTLLPGVLEEYGFHSYDNAFLLSVVGLGDIIGRLGTGFVADLKCVQQHRLKAAAAIACGVNVFFFFISKPWVVAGVQCFLYGLFCGCIICLTVLVCKEFLEERAIPKTLALALLTEGLAVAIGVTGLAFLKDVTGSYSITCIICSIAFFLGAILIYLLPVVARLEKKRISKLATKCQHD